MSTKLADHNSILALYKELKVD